MLLNLEVCMENILGFFFIQMCQSRGTMQLRTHPLSEISFSYLPS